MDDAAHSVTSVGAHRRGMNGRLMIFVLSALFVVAAGAYGVSWRMNIAQAASLAKHTDKFGHTGIEERMRAVEATLVRIESHVKTLVER